MRLDPYIGIRGKSKAYSYRRRYPSLLAEYYQQQFFYLSLQTRELSVARSRAALVSKLFERNIQLVSQGSVPEEIVVSDPERTKTRTELAHELLEQFVSVSRDLSTIPEKAHEAITFALQETAEDARGDIIQERVPVVSDAIRLLHGEDLNEDLPLSVVVRLYEEIKGEEFNPKQVRAALRDWIKEMGDKPLSAYKRLHAQRFVDSYVARGLSTGTAARRVGALVAAINKVNAMHELDLKNVFAGTELTVVQKQRHQITPEEDRKVIEMGFAKNDVTLLIQMLYATGARIAEIAGLTWKCVHLNAEVPHINIRALPHRSLKTKQSERLVPLTGSAAEAISVLRKLHGRDKYVFPRWNQTEKTNADAASAAVKKRLGFGSHSFRHLLATKMREKEVPELTHRLILGHTSLGSGHSDLYGETKVLSAKKAALESLWERG